MVPTMVEETRTVMKPVQKQECYTAYKTEYVTEKKMVTCTTIKKEHYTEMCTKTCCVKVPVWEEKVVMVKKPKIEWVTEYKTKCKVCFTKDYKTIDCGGCGGSKCCGDKCGGDGCGKGFSLCVPVYKPHVTTEVVPCCVPKCTWECVPCVKKCCTFKTEMKTTTVPVCKTRCIPVTEQKEVCCTKKVCVPYQATRCVTVCEPCTETVKVCKMVPTMVEEVCPAPAPANVCVEDNKCGGGDKCCGLCGKLSNCCSKLKDCCSTTCCKVGNCCEKVKDCGSGCCEKLKGCCTSACAKVGNCCSKIKGCFCCK
jgi:hypothetical protein